MPILYTCCVPHPPLIIPEVGKGEEKKMKRKSKIPFIVIMKS